MDEKCALLSSFTRPVAFQHIVSRIEMIGEGSGRKGLGKDLADKFKADMPTEGEIKRLKVGPLSVVLFDVQKTMVDCAKEMMVEGESDRIAKDVKILMHSLDDTIRSATNAALDAKQVKVGNLTVDLPDEKRAR